MSELSDLPNQTVRKLNESVMTNSELSLAKLAIPVGGWRHKQPFQFGRTDPFHLRNGLSDRQVLVNGGRPYSISTWIDHFLPAIFSGCFPFSLKTTDMKLIPNVSSVHVLEYRILIYLEWKNNNLRQKFHSIRIYCLRAVVNALTVEEIKLSSYLII